MYKVRNIETGEVKTVFACSGLHFLFYDGRDENGNPLWSYGEMNQYEPVEEDMR